MIILNRSEIAELIDFNIAAQKITDAYIAASAGHVTLPPVGHITFPSLEADCHIKYGHMNGDPNFVIKVATGFPLNARHGLETGNGLVLVMSAETGQVVAMLHDEMILTDLRTGIGGAIASRTLARRDAQRVLVIGTGVQARCQVQAHSALFQRDLTFQIWGRSFAKAKDVARHLNNATAVQDLESAVRQADIIVTTTGSTQAIVAADWVQPGTHISAVGADAPGKQELSPVLVSRASIVAVDSIAQCVDHGEVSHAIAAGLISTTDLVELGELLATVSHTRGDHDITIADLTGIAAQDIAMANAVIEAFQNRMTPT